MCGLALLFGKNAAEDIEPLLSSMSARGPDDQSIWKNDILAIGFVRLAINDLSLNGRQPIVSSYAISAFNGEIYNAESLATKFNISLTTQCDTHIIQPLYEKLGNKVLEELDGFYSGLIHNPNTNEVTLFRDYIGKKPLFYGKTGDTTFVVSDLSAISNVEWFKPVPLGISFLNLDSGNLIELNNHKANKKTDKDLSRLMEDAVLKRLPQNKFGVFLSGGLDSSIVTALVDRYRKDVIYYVLGEPNSSDLQKARSLVEHLGLERVRYVPLPNKEDIPDLINKLVAVTESYNPSIISNGIATYLLSKAAKEDGLKVVLTGEGADELFGGYHEQPNKEQWQKSRIELINNMKFTELRRLDKCSMAHSIEVRCPFLDRYVKGLTDQLSYPDFYQDGQNKVILRDTFGHLLPREIANRKKASFDVGSGIRKLVVQHLIRNGKLEREELKVEWETHFRLDAADPYFFSYPTFDHLIDKRGAVHK